MVDLCQIYPQYAHTHTCTHTHDIDMAFNMLFYIPNPQDENSVYHYYFMAKESKLKMINMVYRFTWWPNGTCSPGSSTSRSNTQHSPPLPAQ